MDSEVSGTGNQYDYGFRIYNPQIGRFLSVDPLTKSYPMLTPYQFASNRPIDGIDLDGLEWKKVETYNPETGVTNVHFHVVLNVVNESSVFKDIEKLKSETMGQFAAAFEGRVSADGKTSYSASIEVNGVSAGQEGPFSVIVSDMPKGLLGISGTVNTQNNSFILAGGEYDKSSPDQVQSRSAKDMAQDIVHELMHTANVWHPDDDINMAADVDLIPDMSNLDKNGRPLAYKLAPGANWEEVIQNVMLYNFRIIEGRKVNEYEPDKFKRGKVSPDQAKIAAEQIDLDNET